MMQLEERLAAGPPILLDGAIGTELERLGAPMHGEIWCGHAIETHPELISEVHRSYLDAGAEVITANTYAAGRCALEPAGLGDRTEAWNRRAMEIALEARARHARGRDVRVAGSIAPFGVWTTARAEELHDGFAEQASVLVEAGADLLILEMLAAPPDFVDVALEAATGRGVPAWLGISCMEDRQTGQLMCGVEESRTHHDLSRAYAPFADVAAAVDGRADAVLMMHSELAVTRRAVAELRAATTGPVGAYPNAGYWVRPEWAFVDQVEPAEFARTAAGWIDAGATIVGGCCGIGPAHIAAIRRRLDEV